MKLCNEHLPELTEIGEGHRSACWLHNPSVKAKKGEVKLYEHCLLYTSCILVLRVVGLKKMAEEVEISSPFKRKKMYNFFLKYLAPAFLVIILVSSIANVMGWISL